MLSKALKFFTVDLEQRRDVISIDRLKAVHLFENLSVENNNSVAIMPNLIVPDVQVNVPFLRTRSGEIVNLPHGLAQLFSIKNAATILTSTTT